MTNQIACTRSQISTANSPPADAQAGSASTKNYMPAIGCTTSAAATSKPQTAPKKGGRVMKVLTAGKMKDQKATEGQDQQALPLNTAALPEAQSTEAQAVTDKVDSMKATQHAGQTPLDNVLPLFKDGSKASAQAITTASGDQCILKRKSEVEDDNNEYALGANSFSPLLKLTEPQTKKMRNSQQEEHKEDQESDEDKAEMQCLSPSPLDGEGVEEYDDYDEEAVEVITYHSNVDRDEDLSLVMDPGISAAAPYQARDQSFLRAPNTQIAPPSSDLALMFTPTSSLNIITATAKDDGSVSIYKEFMGSFEPHSIPPQHIFHNYDLEQINTLFRSQAPGDILIIMWGLEYKDLTYTTEARIKATIKTFFQMENLTLHITLPSPPLLYKAKGPTLLKVQKFMEDHTGTPFMFYVQGLSLKMKDTLIHEGFLPTTLSSYQVLDASDFVTDFAFTIDGVSAPPNEQGQQLVEKIVKDKLYQSPAVQAFLQAHHDAIDPLIPINKIPSLIILSLEA
ncbi:hypothetical protein EDD18DRAFT_1110008 [Armillaria luteobubalina]|uniref:Uncharacterized protein n=1 Tax=Armillaria luteobubalina TaxID=153913 RepID=A0AA39PT17_9AGAR|nr:hypothetical protein EDD18DRAFT_1110008 [Armillaria luteobubalina]